LKVLNKNPIKRNDHTTLHTNHIPIFIPPPPPQQGLPEEAPKDKRPVGPGARAKGKLNAAAKPYEPPSWKRDGQRLSRSPSTSTPIHLESGINWETAATPMSPRQSAIRPPRPFLAANNPGSHETMRKVTLSPRAQICNPQPLLQTLTPLPPLPPAPTPNEATEGGAATSNQQSAHPPVTSAHPHTRTPTEASGGEGNKQHTANQRITEHLTATPTPAESSGKWGTGGGDGNGSIRGTTTSAGRPTSSQPRSRMGRPSLANPASGGQSVPKQKSKHKETAEPRSSNRTRTADEPTGIDERLPPW